MDKIHLSCEKILRRTQVIMFGNATLQ